VSVEAGEWKMSGEPIVSDLSDSDLEGLGFLQMAESEWDKGVESLLLRLALPPGILEGTLFENLVDKDADPELIACVQ
jgi:hypothetical protein